MEKKGLKLSRDTRNHGGRSLSLPTKCSEFSNQERPVVGKKSTFTTSIYFEIQQPLKFLNCSICITRIWLKDRFA